MNYPINNIYPCIQGEGCQTGVPMIMLRLQGCLVGCPWCDTKETWELNPQNEVDTIEAALGQNQLYTIKVQSEIIYYIVTNYPFIEWVLISGGEPAQYNLEPLVNALHDAKRKAAIETSGTELGHIGAGFDWVCVSPKIDMPGKKVVNPITLETANEIKYVVGKKDHLVQLDKLIKLAKLKDDAQICLQPISQAIKATKICIEAVQDRGWRLSVQIHKYLNIQ